MASTSSTPQNINPKEIHGQLSEKGFEVSLDRIEKLSGRITNNGSNSEFSNSQDGFPNSGGGGGGGAAEAVPAINPSPHARKVAAGIAPPPSSITSESSNAGTRKRKQANPKQNPPTKAARKQVQTQQEYSESGGGGVDAWTIGRSKPPHQAEQHAAIFRPESEQSKSKYKKLFHRRQRQSGPPPNTMRPPSRPGSVSPSQSPAATPFHAQIAKLKTSLELKEKRIQEMQAAAGHEKEATNRKSE
eukprot:gene20535-27220_t